ncbi:MAG: hypothetical protein HYX91_03850 [Chloroflexi bacterium]|nr:hypothetical protein [Chloroflexota bacterium]
MKALAWYTVIFNALIIIFFILAVADVVPKPPFSTTEAIAWIVLSVPVVILGLMVTRRWD